MTPAPLATDEEVAAHLRVDVRTLRRLVERGDGLGVVGPWVEVMRRRRWTGGPGAWQSWAQEVTERWRASSDEGTAGASGGEASTAGPAGVSAPANAPRKTSRERSRIASRAVGTGRRLHL